MLDLDRKISPAEVSRQLKKLGLSAPRKIGPNQFEGEGTASKDTYLHKSLNSKNPLGQHLYVYIHFSGYLGLMLYAFSCVA